MSTQQSYQQSSDQQELVSYLLDELSRTEKQIYEAENHFYRRAAQLKKAIQIKEVERVELQDELQQIKKQNTVQKMEIMNWQIKLTRKQNKKMKPPLKSGSRKQLRMFDFRSEESTKNNLRFPCSPKPKFP